MARGVVAEEVEVRLLGHERYLLIGILRLLAALRRRPAARLSHAVNRRAD